MRILIILAQYYPVVNPNVYRWGAIAEHWAGEGHEVHILCTRRSGTPNETAFNGVYIHRAGHATLLDWVHNILRKRQRRHESDNQPPPPPSRGRLFLEKLTDWTWRKIYWPDGSCIWYLAGRKRALQLQQQYNFEAVISVTLPFTTNLIAMAIKKRHTKVIWLIDIEDPFAISDAFWVNNFKLYHRKNFRAEARTLRLADHISLTVETARNCYCKAFPDLPILEKMRVIPPMLNEARLEDTVRHFDFAQDKTHIAYFGTFYERVRTPCAWLEILQNLLRQEPVWQQRLQMHFFGEMPPKVRLVFDLFPELSEIIILHGLATRAEVKAAIDVTDFLLNIGNTTNYHLPSKSAEYILSGKPIINLCQHPDDTFKHFAQDYPLICHLFAYDKNTMHTAPEQLSNFIKNHRGRRVEKSLLQQWQQQYAPATIAGAYWRLLTGATKQSQ